jgi:hypothetical protein
MSTSLYEQDFNSEEEFEEDVLPSEDESEATASSGRLHGPWPDYDDDDDDDYEPSYLGYEDRQLYYSLLESLQLQDSEQDSTQQDGQLSLLPSMPMDILFQVFVFLRFSVKVANGLNPPKILSALPPEDLLTLCSVNRSFRNHLLDRNATTVWKAARQRTSCPAPLEDFSELRWAKLVFGRPLCEVRT